MELPRPPSFISFQSVASRRRIILHNILILNHDFSERHWDQSIDIIPLNDFLLVEYLILSEFKKYLFHFCSFRDLYLKLSQAYLIFFHPTINAFHLQGFYFSVFNHCSSILDITLSCSNVLQLISSTSSFLSSLHSSKRLHGDIVPSHFLTNDQASLFFLNPSPTDPQTRGFFFCSLITNSRLRYIIFKKLNNFIPLKRRMNFLFRDDFFQVDFFE